MSLWMCPKCTTFAAPEHGPCPTCGTPTEYVYVASQPGATSVAWTHNGSLEEIARLTADNEAIRAQLDNLERALTEDGALRRDLAASLRERDALEAQLLALRQERDRG